MRSRVGKRKEAAYTSRTTSNLEYRSCIHKHNQTDAQIIRQDSPSHTSSTDFQPHAARIYLSDWRVDMRECQDRLQGILVAASDFVGMTLAALRFALRRPAQSCSLQPSAFLFSKHHSRAPHCDITVLPSKRPLIARIPSTIAQTRRLRRLFYQQAKLRHQQQSPQSTTA